MEAKEFYRNYTADNELSPLSYKVMELIASVNPIEVFEFGCGTGKHIKALRDIYNIDAYGADISLSNAVTAIEVNKCETFIISDEVILQSIRCCDVVFTVSVLDHIEDVDWTAYKLIHKANKLVLFAETNDTPGEFYYPHDYEKYGLTKILDFEWVSPADGAKYYIWAKQFSKPF